MIDIDQPLIKRCLSIIKQALKSKQMTYRQVAIHLDLSEISVKRLLNQNDISFERLLRLARLVELDISELIEQAKKYPAEQHYFTDKQDEAFFRFPHLLSYFSALFYERLSIEEIAEANQLSDLSTYLYLRMLADVQLIELEPQNKFEFLVAPPLGFSANSRVLKRLIKRHIKETCDVVMSSDKLPEQIMIVKPLELPAPIYAELINELDRVISRYAEISESPKSSAHDIAHYQVIMVGHPRQDDEHQDAKICNIDSNEFSLN